MILAGDIGGTKTNLAYFDVREGKLVLVVIESFPSARYQTLNEVILKMRSEHPGEITAAAFGVAGPVVKGRSKLTNLGWDVDEAEVASNLNLARVGLLNDIEATAYGTLRLGEHDRVSLNPEVGQKEGTIAVIAAGTGLGEGGLFWDGAQYRAIASEGGHTDFAPRDEVEIGLLRYLLTKYERVSYERVLSGSGLCTLYEFFRSTAQYPEPAWLRDSIASGDPAAAISKAAMDETDIACVQALDLFVSLYGAEAGNLALKLLSTGGVFVAGGIAPKILRRIQRGEFCDSFTRKGRYAALMRRIPISVVLNDKTALFGAAHFALMC